LYAENTIVEPSDVDETLNGGKGPDVGTYQAEQVIVNVWLWPSVRFIYAPRYVIWHSPWRWNLYPNWFRPWKPYRYSVFMVDVLHTECIIEEFQHEELL